MGNPKETYLIGKIIARAKRIGRVKDGLVLCDNCDTPASKSLSTSIGSTICGPCAWGESDSFNENDLISVTEAR